MYWCATPSSSTAGKRSRLAATHSSRVFASVSDAVGAAVDVPTSACCPPRKWRAVARPDRPPRRTCCTSRRRLPWSRRQRAARVTDAAHVPNSRVRCRAHALGRLEHGLGLRDLGRHRLKDAGAERLWQVEADGLAAGPFRRLAASRRIPRTCRYRPPSFVGREAEMSQLAGLVAANQVVTVTGAGGIGSSRGCDRDRAIGYRTLPGRRLLPGRLVRSDR